MGLIGPSEDDDKQKPLANKWFKRVGKDATDTVERIKLSGSGEWIVIHCTQCVALLNAQSKAGKSFWAFAIQLEGEYKILQLVYAKGKLGWDLEPGDRTTQWSVNLDDEEITCAEWEDFLAGGSGVTGGLTTLTLEMMSSSPAASNPATRTRNGKK